MPTIKKQHLVTPRQSTSGIVRRSHEALKSVVKPGDRVVDATVGNGGDALFAAELVGHTGFVLGLDVQPQALATTRIRTAESAFTSVIQLHESGHENLERVVPPEWLGKVAAFIFNLGYLPGGNQSITTQPESTIAALFKAVPFIRPGGIMVVSVYRGHFRAMEEFYAVSNWMNTPAIQWGETSMWISNPDNPKSPVLFVWRRFPIDCEEEGSGA